MKNILGTQENLTLKDENGVVRYKFSKDLLGEIWESKYDGNGIRRNQYIKLRNGYSYMRTYNEKGKVLSFENSNGYWIKYTRDEEGNILTYKDSQGEYGIKGKRKVTKEEFENFVNSTKEHTMAKHT